MTTQELFANLESKIDRLLRQQNDHAAATEKLIERQEIVEQKLEAVLGCVDHTRATDTHPRPDITPAELARLRRRHGKSVIDDFNRKQNSKK